MSSQPYPSAVPASVAVAAGTTAADALAAAGVDAHRPPGAVVVRGLATGALKDLDWAPDEDVEVEPVPLDSPDGLAVLRHSTAHVMAQAVQDLFPGTRLGIGPPIETASTTTSCRPARSPRRTWTASRSGCRRSSRPGSGSPAGRSPTTRPGPSWPTSRSSWS